jgi:EAL domain-containing protein (putative c-di-GMP-specific phosphodiesterase class I)
MALRDTMGRLRAMGVGIALDDFGTGYSALGYLTRFPIDTLKLDRIFVGTLGRDRRAGALVDGLVALANALELRTVGEGIETEGQRRALLAAGCELGQGHLLGRPADAGTVVRRLAHEAALRP